MKRTTSYSSRIQHTLPREEREAVSSVWLVWIPLRKGIDPLEKVLVFFNCVRKRIVEDVGEVNFHDGWQ